MAQMESLQVTNLKSMCFVVQQHVIKRLKESIFTPCCQGDKCLESRKIHLEHSGQLTHSFYVSVAFLIVNFPSTMLFI